MPFIVYKITHRISSGGEKLYVGVTQRSLSNRISTKVPD